MPLFPAMHCEMSGRTSRTLKSGNGEGGTNEPINHLGSDQQPVCKATDESVAGFDFRFHDPLVGLVRPRDMARPADDRRDAGVLEEAPVGAVADLPDAVRT